ncbi:Chromosome partition protein smc [hydrothermal vent metagenome]|uniref:Chromosome partition protein smc n=1 Tax=hydrothermal vent metagenome TaxID=652676 RepID=A0A3B0S3E6_9ZZZZ
MKAMATLDDDSWVPVSENLEVSPGFERALAVALGDDLQASTQPDAPAHWDAGETPKQSLPGNVQVLAELVSAPDALSARLSQIGVVDFATGEKLAASLLPGQRLVSREGHLWRWDGLRLNADVPSAAAHRLEQKNRLAALEPLGENCQKQTMAHRESWLAAKETRAELQQVLKTDRQQLPALDKTARRAEQVWQELQRGGIEREARAISLGQKHQHWTSELVVARDELRAAEKLAAQAPDQEDSKRTKALENARLTRDEARLQSADAEAALRSAQRENENRLARLSAIEAEMSDWSKRAEAGATRSQALETRQQATNEKLQQAQAAPDAINTRRKQVFAECETAEQRLGTASDALAEADSLVRQTRDANRAAESAASAARETRAALSSKVESAEERVSEITNTIREALGCEPEELDNSQQNLRKIPSNAQEAEARLHKLRAERDNIGGVNLQAEEQAEELAARLDNMQADREELTAAIAKLRKGVNNLNAEGRARLLAAFETINTHFKSLFLTLFGGGEAELRLTESDDPLEAGLEIFACPPGKKMGVMSLMSGGEQALTAMALIFAVFLSNPAPVCVLDEVDAPLDDANVERFCAMLDEMRTRTQTRFIVITHNPLTMSRVDRLYGVTMAERGVSQLVSVDLQRAEDLIAAE